MHNEKENVIIISPREHVAVLDEAPLEDGELGVGDPHDLQRTEVGSVGPQLLQQQVHLLAERGLQQREPHVGHVVSLERGDAEEVGHERRVHLGAEQQPQREAVVQQVHAVGGERCEREVAHGRQDECVFADHADALGEMRGVFREGATLRMREREEENRSVQLVQRHQRGVQRA